MSDRLVGTSVRRVEDSRILTGRGRFVDDRTLPDMVVAAFVRSPIPHGYLRSIDVEAARAVPGVVGVFVAEDIESITGQIGLTQSAELTTTPFSVLARDKVRYVGDPIVLVVATSRYSAEDGCDLVEIDYEPIAPIVSAEAALDPSAPAVFDENGGNLLHESHHTYGDVEDAFSGARIVRATLSQHRVANLPMETRGGLADYNANAQTLTFFASHQNPQSLRYHLSTTLGLPMASTHVVCADVGGSFGQKGYLSREDLAICSASMLLSRPVKWIEDRTENLIAGGHSREDTATIEAAVDDRGTVLGLRVNLLVDHGAYPVVPFPLYMVTNIVRTLLPGPYRIPAVDFTARIASTNKGSYVAYRGPWESETWMRERLFDIVARELGLDQATLRLQNLPGDDELPYRMVTGPTVNDVWAKRSLHVMLDRLAYAELRAELAEARKAGRLVGLGLAMFMEPAPGPADFGVAIGFPRGLQRARARLDPDGRLSIFTSQMPHGQGHETTLAQVAADELNLGHEDIRLVYGDTRVTPFAMVGTGGSRSATLASGAVAGAAAALGGKICAVAAFMLDTEIGQVELSLGQVRSRVEPGRSVSLADVARMVYMTGFRIPPGVPVDLEADFDYAVPPGGWTQATHACVAEIDPVTGLVSIERYVVVEDCGRVINPAIVEGQVRGGVTQGIGAVLLEHATYDESGQFITATMMDYLIPTTQDVPPIEVVHLETPPVPWRTSRGVGEGGAIGSPAAVVNAIEDALSELNVAVREQHLPPARILELIGTIADHSKEH